MNVYKITASFPTEKLPAPKKVVIPLSQHIGVPCTAKVAAGDTVDKGQIIGEVEKGLGCPVHSPVSGKVLEINTFLTPQGRKIEQVVIENDGEERLSPLICPYATKLEEVTPELCIEAVRLAGISGMGGATFPTYAKISSAILLSTPRSTEPLMKSSLSACIAESFFFDIARLTISALAYE
jgi:electron transport complex protein RnfC